MKFYKNNLSFLLYTDIMFRSTENQDCFYRISCSDWEYICLAESHYEASVKALKEMVKLKGGKLNLSFTLISDRILDL